MSLVFLLNKNLPQSNYMYNKTLLLFSLVFLLGNLSVNAQHSGNQVYQNQSQSYNRNPVTTQSISSTDSTLIITSKVLLNQKADNYLLTIGVNQSAKTVLEASQIINSRIEKVISKSKGLGIGKNDIYVDFISETKNYDHNITDREITEYLDGFNIRKNIIVKTKDLQTIDKIINFCSEQEIHDIIKVDYVTKDIEMIQKDLFAEALKIIQKKKSNFEKNSSIAISNNYRLAAENLKIYYPKNLYKQYNEAFETSLVTTNYNSSFLKKEVRKEKTFYYDGVETEVGVDKIIDNISPIVGIQYVIEVKVIYELKGND